MQSISVDSQGAIAVDTCICDTDVHKCSGRSMLRFWELELESLGEYRPGRGLSLVGVLRHIGNRQVVVFRPVGRAVSGLRRARVGLGVYRRGELAAHGFSSHKRPRSTCPS